MRNYRNTFDYCNTDMFEEHRIVVFVYDWECTYDRNYNIYWCGNSDVLKSYLQEHTISGETYCLKKLKKNWYYVGW